jgi:hypothetical protein
MSQFGALGELALGAVPTAPAAPQQVNSAAAGALGEFALGEQGASQTSNTLGIAFESDTAFSIQALKTYAVGLASEADSALAITINRIHAVGLASETDSAFGVNAFRSGKRSSVSAIAS